MAQKEIDPRFFLPPGVVDLGYEEIDGEFIEVPVQEDGDGSVEVSMEVNATWDDSYFDSGNFGGNGEALSPPDNMTVVSQTVRTTSGGIVVDVVIDVTDPSGVGQYDVRITK